VSSAAHAFKKIVSESGVRGLWKGSIPNVQRAALVNLGDLTTYDTAKQVIMHKTGLPDSHLLHCLSRYTFIVFIILHKLLRFLSVIYYSSICAGLVAATLGTPADVVKTRVMNQPTDKNGM